MNTKKDLLQWLIVFFGKLLASAIENKILLKEQLTEQLHNPIIRKLKKRKV